MSKYNKLWEYIKNNSPSELSFGEVEDICGFPIDHSFLSFKKELEAYGYRVAKISIKNKTVKIERMKPGELFEREYNYQAGTPVPRRIY